jgi:hypothetical protein
MWKVTKTYRIRLELDPSFPFIELFLSQGSKGLFEEVIRDWNVT